MADKMGSKVWWGIFPKREQATLIQKRKFSSLILLKSGAVKEFQNRALTFEWSPFKKKR
jgi:hypothetical protein